MSKSTIKNPHDKLFRASMRHPEVVREFLTMHLPAEIIKKIDLKSIVICASTFIDEELKLTESDILLKCNIEGKDGYIYTLAEHQSTQDPMMPFRLLKYIIKIWDYHQVNTKKKNALPFPVILPLVFYTGDGIYKGPRAIWELCGSQADLMQKIVQSPFHLIDINTVPEHTLTTRMWAGTMEFLMRHRFRQHVEQELEKIAKNINYLMLEEKNQFVLQLLSYIMAVDEEHHNVAELTTIIHDKLSPEVEKEIMSLAEKLMKEGELKGELKGKLNKSLEIAEKMIADGVEPAFIAKYTGISLEKLKKLQTKN